VNEPATLGRGLGRSIAVATVAGMIVFGIVVAIVIYIAELGEECAPGIFVDDPPLVIIKECAVALAFAAPLGIALSLLMGRKLTHGTTERLDEVIETASRMTGERLDERLPVGHAGDALDRLSQALNGLLERVEGGVAAQRQFAADASHELRTPLTVISTNLEVARRKMRDTSHWEHVADDVLAQARRMQLLIDKLLELSRAGAAGLQHQRQDLRSLAGEVVERADALGAKVKVKVELVAGPPVDADIDADAIAIVLDNLLRNAIDHSPPGETVSVTIEGRRSITRLIVDDRGPGVPADMRQRIFEPFARGVQPATDRSVGTGFGLGLAICKRIVVGHAGTIAVHERHGGGARFVVTLPLPGVLELGRRPEDSNPSMTAH
jgi:two-component system OmpR family sensor kinase